MQRKTAMILAGVGLAVGIGVWFWQRQAAAATSGHPGIGPTGPVRTTTPGLPPTAREIMDIAAHPQVTSGHNRF